MKLSQSAVESLLQLGHFQKIVSDWAEDPPSVSALSSAEHRLAIAEALLRTGRIEPSKLIATTVLERTTQKDIRAKCEMLLGLAAREMGFFEEAIRRLHTSARLAKDAGSTSQAAWSLLAALRIVAERQPKEVLSSALQELRNLVTRAGDPRLTALLHESVARHEAQVGNLDEARRHLRVATGLLLNFPNAWVEQLVAINEFCVEFSNCDLTRAEQKLAQAQSLAPVSGALAEIIANNLGHMQLQVGRFSEAEKTLSTTAHRNVGHVLQSALDGLARLHLACNRLEDCTKTLNSLSAVEKSAELVPSFPFRSSLLTRVRLLSRQARWQETIETANVAISEAEPVADSNVLAMALMLQGLAFAKIGSNREAASSFARAGDAGAWTLREHQGFAFQICSQLMLDRDARVAAQWFTRAKRVWRIQGNRAAETEFQEFAAQLATASNGRRRGASSIGSDLRITSTLSSLARLFDLSYSPKLIADEINDVIDELGCSSSTAANDKRQVTLVLGQSPVPGSASQVLTLRYQVPDDPLKAILLGDVLRIGRAAVALERAREEERNRAALWPADPIADQGDAIFLAEEMQALLATVRRIAPTTVPVLITGETGTGKEVLARTIHACSTRAKNLFLPFNCASTPKDMLDSQLFGHRRGAFTGALEHFPGVIRTAAGGTLFLDEIGDTSLDVQPKLLRFLDSREVHGIGEAQPTRVDVRVIVATNVDVDRLVTEGRFREDLFYRLSIVRLHIPPLRERRVEIPSLANHYLRKHAQEYGKGNLRLSEDTMEYLVLYKWPGNVRQLASEMRRLAALAESDAVLMPEHLSRDIAASRRTIPPSERALDPTEVIVRLDQPIPAATQYLEQVMIQYALKTCGGRIEETAAMLGISRKGLYLKRLRFGIDPPGDTDVAAAAAGA